MRSLLFLPVFLGCTFLCLYFCVSKFSSNTYVMPTDSNLNRLAWSMMTETRSTISKPGGKTGVLENSYTAPARSVDIPRDENLQSRAFAMMTGSKNIEELSKHGLLMLRVDCDVQERMIRSN